MDAQKFVVFLSYWVANTVVLLILSLLFSTSVVLGNDRLSMPAAAFFAGLLLTLFMVVGRLAIEKSGFVKSLKGLKVKDENLWVGIFLAINFVGVWIIKRMAEVTGFGVASLLHVAVIAVVATLAGWIVSKYLVGASKK